MEAFRAYFLSHAAFVVRVVPDPLSLEGGEKPSSSEPAAAAATGGGDGGASSAGAGAEMGKEGGEDDDDRVDVWGAFYIKPNFPGRCSHVCNGGFITDPRRRRRGVARLMGYAFLRLAKDLGYRASYFNLVNFEFQETSAATFTCLC